MRDHRRLRAFELADELALEIYRATKDFPHEERFGLTSQLRRAAVSVPSNIVEGCARNSLSDYLRFLDISFASCRELGYQLSLANRLGYLNPNQYTQLDDLYNQTASVLNGLTPSLRKRQSK